MYKLLRQPVTLLFLIHPLPQAMRLCESRSFIWNCDCAFTPDATCADKSRYSCVVGRLNILSLLASFAREIHFTTDANSHHGGASARRLQSRCKMADMDLLRG